jgi:RNA-binding protein
MDLEKPPPFSTVDISVIIHATEDENKILESLSTILGVHPNKFRHMESIGHWGNRIILTTGRLESAEANTPVKKILNSLNSMERGRLSNSLQSFIDEKGNLYLRLDKQRICQKRVSLAESDSVRLRFRPTRRFKMDRNQGYLERGLLSSKE